MIFRPDRRQRGHDPALGQKMLFFVVGAVLGITGIATDRGWLVYIALAVLVLGVLMRFARRPAGRDDDGGTPPGDDHTAG